MELITERLEKVRQVIDEILRSQPDEEERRCGFVHLYGVSAICVILAKRRGLDAGLAATAGMLHDIWTYKTNDPQNHDRQSALEAREILMNAGGYSYEEVELVCQAIENHSQKNEIDGPLAELLKDADTFQHHLYNPGFPVKWKDRLNKVLQELEIG